MPRRSQGVHKQQQIGDWTCPNGTASKPEQWSNVIAALALIVSVFGAGFAYQSVSTAQDALTISMTDGVRMRLAEAGRSVHLSSDPHEQSFDLSLMLYLVETYLVDAETFGIEEYADKQEITAGSLRALVSAKECRTTLEVHGLPVASYVDQSANPKSHALAVRRELKIDCPQRR